MSPGARRNAITVVLAFVAALAGVMVGSRMSAHDDQHGTELHALIHRKIRLDAAQEVRLDQLEARFAVTRAGLETQMRADNAALAAAIAREHGNGPAVTAAVDRSHRTMGALQKATLAHVFAMRSLLRADQATTFDRVVVRALTAAP